MNIIRRLLGREKAAPPAEQPTRPKAEEVEEPQNISIPGIAAEISTAVAPNMQVPFGATRQLPPVESALTQPNQHISYGQTSDVGMVRATNQDAVLTFFTSQGNSANTPDFGLFIVADGMGGHHDGEKASAIATQVLAEQVARKIYLPMLQNHQPDPEGTLPIAEVLAEAVRSSNERVVKAVPEGGTTITAVVIVGDLAHIVHVGDSRAYLITRQYGIEQITRDHSLVQRLIELDQLTPEEAAQHPQKNVLYRAIGQSDNLEVDSITRRLPPDSYLLLCSDGLWNMVPEESALDIVLHAATPQSACDRLVAVANERGGTDNISAVLLQVPG